ncbi:MAG: class I SAM-dependent DNA methyltransferase [Sphingobacteriales bacterium JAD_PAG50586_3]|nr:MAG: class I SAM-dependent DNA methyltransferase [Sphingobacteriales bacterium JAD_PAG50586_3]
MRILFCLFAEDTTIFQKQQFQDFIEQRTNVDGSDLASKLQELFQVLNTDKQNRFKNLDEQLADFPYVNGKLFEENLPTASFDSKMRQALLDCCYLDWSRISPAIFGSMFQSVMNPKERRNLGAHYTSEKNILKLIKPLFLDELWKEFELVKGNKNKLQEFHKRISNLKFLDPACGCGNFLVITYRELRLLEIEILRALNKSGQGYLDVRDIIWLDVDMMYGIEYEEFPARIAEVAMWLIDHQMNMLISSEFGQYFVRLPLKKAAKITHGNALRIDWQSLLNPVNSIDVYAQHANIYLAEEPKPEYKSVNVQVESFEIHKGTKPEQSKEVKFDYIIGNPPFGGKHLQSKEQKSDLIILMKDIRSASDLDYIAAWFYKAALYIQNTTTKVAFVSTNSITQGEQVPILWDTLINSLDIKINFAHQTFKWKNEAKGIAAVHCIIIGFSTVENKVKKLYEYESVSSEPHELTVQNINPYLYAGPVVIVNKKSKSICNAPPIKYGNKPTDDGNYIFNDEEKAIFLSKEPKSKNYFKKFIGSVEFINNISRWCLWLKDIDPKELKQLPYVLDRVERVKKFREKSTALPTQKSALFPTLFFYISHPQSDYLVIPETSSIKRKFIPIGYVSGNTIASNAVYLIPSATLFTFGIMCSTMHMAWIRTIGGV